MLPNSKNLVRILETHSGISSLIVDNLKVDVEGSKRVLMYLVVH